MNALVNRWTQRPTRILGLMSGTSLDGLDIALIEWDSDDLADFRVADVHTFRYDAALQKDILQTITGTASDVCQANVRLGKIWGDYIRTYLADRDIPAQDIACIGSHGQTIWHESGESTLQIGESAEMSALTGIPVISNFREQDIAHGGIGAPLIPFLDWLLYRDLPGSTVALNIGGIANITCLSESMEATDVIGWDTGPGNMVMNTLASLATAGEQSYDKDGTLARRGTVNERLLQVLMNDEFVTKTPPKSTGREYYSEAFVRNRFDIAPELEEARLADALATACEWTAQSIISNITRFWKPLRGIDRLVISGGGVHNLSLMERLASHLPNTDILTCDEYGIAIDAKEAIGFAVLAMAFISGIPANLPGVTGARKSVVLGKLTK